MKKSLIVILIAFIIITLMPVTGTFKAEADSYYPIACNASEFEVSYIEDDGSFTKVSCHSSLSDAKKAMRQNSDYVVRYSKSYSASKIVAMNSGLAYTYPARKNSATMSIYQDPNNKDVSTYKTTYVAGYYQMTYVDTCGADIYDVATNGKGYVRIVLNGFEGFADLEYTDLVPTKFVDRSIPIYLGGEKGGYCSYASESPYRVILEQDYYEIRNNGNYQDMVFVFHKSYPKDSSAKALSYTWSVDNAQNYLDAGMRSGVRYFSDDGINYYTDSTLNNKVATVYNYYQFLPVRSKTAISANTFDTYMNNNYGNSSVMANEGQTFINAQNKYGCNALIIYAMACLESAHGTSGYATKRNNLFGWSAYDDSPDDASYFSSIEVCVNEQMGRNLNWFLDYTNRRYFGSCVGNKGAGFNVQYASDPFWGLKIAALAYLIDKNDNNKNGKLTDYNRYAVGFVKNNYNDVLYGRDVYWDPNIYKSYTGNDVLYTARYGSHYQKDLTVIVLEEGNGRYKIQSTNPVTNGSINTDDGVIKYNWDDSVGYINKDDVVLLYRSDIDDKDRPEPTYAPLFTIRDLSLTDDVLHINGVGAIQGMDFIDPDKIEHKIIFYSLADNSKVLEVITDDIDSNGYSLNDEYNYKYSGFDINITLSDETLPVGAYLVKLNTVNNDKSVESSLFSSVKEFRNISSVSENRLYNIRMNDNIEYRFEIETLPYVEELDYTLINKPSARTSLQSLDEITIGEDASVSVKAHAYMYYLNYDNTDDIKYDLYLMDNNGNYLKLETALYDSGIDYKKILNSKYNINNICFASSSNLAQLEDGDYALVLKMSNVENGVTYTDICNLTNYGLTLPTLKLDGRNYEFYTSKIRNRIMLKVYSDTIQEAS